MSDPGLGYVIDHPSAVASLASTTHWPLSLLVATQPPVGIPPARWLDQNIAPDALDQNGLGACVAFAACTIWNAAEHKDWGRWLFASGDYAPPTGAYLAYDWLKHGSPDGSYPGDGYDGEGSWPEAVWQLATKYGLPDAQGRVHKASAYYAMRMESPADLVAMQQAIMAVGPLNIATVWRFGFNPPTAPEYRVSLGGINGAHSYTIAGWETYDGEVFLTCLNSWGAWGSPQGIFRFPARWLFEALGPQIVWKVTDIEDAPRPEPLPPVGSTTVLAADAIPRLLDAPAGTQLYKQDGRTPLAKLAIPGVALYSPCAFNRDNYQVRIKTANVWQLGVVRKAACRNVRPYPGTATASIQGVSPTSNGG